MAFKRPLEVIRRDNPLAPGDAYTPTTEFGRGYQSAQASMVGGDYARRMMEAELSGNSFDRQRYERAKNIMNEYAARAAPTTPSGKDVTSIGTALDYASGLVGAGVASLGLPIAAGAIGGAVGGPVGGFLGAAIPSYNMNKGEALKKQYEDEVLSQAPVEVRNRTATLQALGNSALDAVGVGKLLSKGGLAGKMLVEGGTEVAQEGVNYIGEKSIDPEREADKWAFFDAFMGGALTGGAVGATTSLGHRLTQAALARDTAVDRADFVNKAFTPDEDGGPRTTAEEAIAKDITSGAITVEEAANRITAHDEALAEITPKRVERMLEDPNTSAEVRERLANVDPNDLESQLQVAKLDTQWRGEKRAVELNSIADKLKQEGGVKREVSEADVKRALDRTPGIPEDTVKRSIEAVLEYDTPNSKDSIYDTPPDKVSNLKRVVDVLNVEPTHKDSLLAVVAKATHAEKDAISDKPNIIMAMAEDPGSIGPSQMREIGKTIDELSLYDRGVETAEQTAALILLDEVFGTRDKTLTVVDHYAQKNLPNLDRPTASLAAAQYIGVDKPTLTFDNPTAIRKVAKPTIEQGVTSEPVSLLEYANEHGANKEELLTMAYGQVKDPNDMSRLAVLEAEGGIDAALAQFTIGRMRPERNLTDVAGLKDAIGEAVVEYPQANLDRRWEIKQILKGVQPTIENKKNSANPMERADADKMMQSIKEAEETFTEMDRVIEETPLEQDTEPSSEEWTAAELREVLKNLPESKVKFSKQDAAAETSAPIRLSKEEQTRIKKELHKTVGPDLKVLFEELTGAVGEFSTDDINRTIKISLSSLNPMSVAHHESIHALMSMLHSTQGNKDTRDIIRTLDETASTRAVMDRMKELLKGSPEAIKQIELNREERIAYMYQFWQAGDAFLTIDPKTTKGILQKIKDFISKSLSVLIGVQGSRADLGKTQTIFNAFAQGEMAHKLSEPSHFAKAVERVLRKDESARLRLARQVMEPIHEGFYRWHTATADQLRHFQDEGLTKIADLFMPSEVDREGGIGFLQGRTQEYARFTNQYAGHVTKGYTKEEINEAARNLASMKDPSNDLEKNFKEFFDKVHTYITDAGVSSYDANKKVWNPIRKVERFFPRYWSAENITNNKDKLVGLMEKYNPDVRNREEAMRMVEALIGDTVLSESNYSLAAPGKTPSATSANSRQFKFINEDNAHEFAEFFNLDAGTVMHKYLYQMTHRAEFAKRFGNDGEVIHTAIDDFKMRGGTDREVQRVRQLIARLDGTIGAESSQVVKDAMSAAITAQNFMLLGFVLFSSLVDPLGIAARTGDVRDAWRGYKEGIKGIFSQIRGADEKRLAKEKMARFLGIIDDANMLDLMGIARDTTAIGKWSRKANALLFRYNGMDQWTSSTRIAAMEAGRAWVVENKANERYMRELGLTESMIYESKPGELAIHADDIMKADPSLTREQAEAISNKVAQAMFMFVDQAVIRPNAATRPAWMDDPRFKFIAHLKQFTYAFTHNILGRAKSEYNHGNTEAIKALSLYVPFMLASDLARGAMVGADIGAIGVPEMLSRATSRSGLMGVGSFYADIASDAKYGKMPGSSLLGPTIDYIMLIIKAIFGGASWESVGYRTMPNVISAPLKNVLKE